MSKPRKNISFPTLRNRDDDANTFVRWQQIELAREQPKESNKVRVIASTDNPVDWGYFREILLHKPDCVDVRAAATCLFNHNRNMPIGGIESCEVDGKTMTAVLDIDPEARAESGIKILEGIRKGWIRGVSIGYQYDMERDAQIVTENDVTTVTVRKWRLREISITPTQADVTAQVTRTQETIKTRSAKSTTHTEEKAMNEAQRAQLRLTLRAMGLSEAEINDILKREGLTMETGLDAANAIVAQRAAQNQHKNEIEAARAEERARCLRITEMARAFDLDPKKYLEIKDEEKARAEMAKDHAENLKNAGKNVSKNGNVRKNDVEVGTEECEKVRECAVNALLARTQGMKVAEDKLQGNPFAGRRVTDIARMFAQRMGHVEAAQWSDREAAAFAIGVGRGVHEIRARNANVFSGAFDSYVLANVMDKAVVAGFKAFEQNMTYNLWTRIREVSDFKQVNGAALDVGNLVQTPEGSPFPELVKAEFGYNAALQMWGVTASLNEQVIINDDLAEFFSQVFRAGAIAQRTIEKEVYYQLETGTTWTDNTSSSAGLGTGASPTPANLDVPRKAFRNKTGPAGEKLGNVPKFLIHMPDIALPVDIALGRVVNYSGVQASVRSSSMIPIEAPFLAGTSTTYYLAGDPNIVDTMVILMLAGQMVPRVEEYDAGAVAAKKWKISLPFAAKSVVTSVNLAAGSTAYIAPGLQKATV